MELRTHIVGLVISCPMGKETVDCPFTRYRNKPLNKINETVNHLPHEEIIALTKHHKKCLHDRLNEIGKDKAIKIENQSANKKEHLPFYHFLSF